MTTGLFARRCCSAPDAPRVVLAGDDGLFIAERPGEPVPRETVEPFKVDRALAHHEVAHALAAIAVGGVVNIVTVKAAHPFARTSDVPHHVPGTSISSRAVTSLAGPAAECLARGFLVPEAETEIRETHRRVAGMRFGSCDQCNAMLCALDTSRIDDADHAVTRYRAAEELATKIVTSEPGRRFLRIAAHELLKRGEVEGSFFHDLAREVLLDNFLETITRSAIAA